MFTPTYSAFDIYGTMGMVELIRKISTRDANGTSTSVNNENEQNLPNTSSISTASNSQNRENDNQSSSVANNLVARADAQGKPMVTHLRRRANKQKSVKIQPGASNQNHEFRVEELDPAYVSPKCKPNDVILLYRDISDLASTGVTL